MGCRLEGANSRERWPVAGIQKEIARVVLALAAVMKFHKLSGLTKKMCFLIPGNRSLGSGCLTELDLSESHWGRISLFQDSLFGL